MKYRALQICPLNAASWDIAARPTEDPPSKPTELGEPINAAIFKPLHFIFN